MFCIWLCFLKCFEMNTDSTCYNEYQCLRLIHLNAVCFSCFFQFFQKIPGKKKLLLINEILILLLDAKEHRVSMITCFTNCNTASETLIKATMDYRFYKIFTKIVCLGNDLGGVTILKKRKYKMACCLNSNCLLKYCICPYKKYNILSI